MAVLVIAAAFPVEWISLSQSRYGLTLDSVRAQQRYNSSSENLRPEAALGLLWAAPHGSARGLGGGIGGHRRRSWTEATGGGDG